MHLLRDLLALTGIAAFLGGVWWYSAPLALMAAGVILFAGTCLYTIRAGAK